MKVSSIFMSVLLFCISGEATLLPKAAGFSENAAVYVKGFQDDRIYLKSEYLTVSEDGMYLLDQFNQKIPLIELFSDSQGLYTKIGSFGTDIATVYPIVWCHTCNGWRTVNIKGLCSKCGNPP